MANDDKEEVPCNTVENNSPAPLVVFVTGFGPFHNVHSNPTATLAEKIVGHLQAWESASSSSSSSNSADPHPPIQPTPRLSLVTHTEVIETSAQAAHEAIDRFYKKLQESSSNSTRNTNGEESTTNNNNSSKVAPTAIFLHLGVNEGGTGFQLESCAYNEATFRLPDERGHQPLQEPIVNHMELNAPLHTSLDVPNLVSRLNNDHRSFPTVQSFQSHDPGRYVCNYTYFLSLHQCHQLRTSIPDANVHCLFLHVPPFRIVPEHEQLEFVGRLLRLLQQQVSDPSRARERTS